MIDDRSIHEALKYHFGFENFKGDQLQIIKSLLEGHDVFVLMPTGGGKSLCYQLPAMMMEGTSIIISPLIALMKNQVDAMRHYGEEDGIAHFLNSSLTKSAAEKVRRDVLSGKTKLLFFAPESLTKQENIDFLKEVKISFYAIDEAHCISEWGHDFRPEYRKIRPMINSIGSRPVIALTATATAKVQHDIQKNLGMLDAKVFKSSFNRKNLYYEVRPKTRESDREIVKYIKANHGKSGIIYCLSRKKVEEVAEMLRINNISALPYHAGMDANTRAKNQDAFLMEKVDVIVATIAFGMGIDKPDVRYVIHYDIPKSIEGYYQETGRAGRDGGEGVCITYYSHKDLQKLDKLIQSKSPLEQEISRQLLIETSHYAESSVCRRKILLHYFGEDYEEENCGNCDNCLHPKTKIDATDELQNVIESVMVLGEEYKVEYLVQFLVGRKTDEIRANGHDQFEQFGSCKHHEDKFITTVIRQGIIAGYLLRDIENYGIVKVTQQGREYLESPQTFMVVEDNDYSDLENDGIIRESGSNAADPQLYAILKDLCKSVAIRHNLPSYVVFQDSSLEAMSTAYPVTEEELLCIPGVGNGKAKRFGKEFLELIAKYVEENEIERPEDIRVRMVANKSKVKIYIIQGIDRKIPLDDLASSKGLEFSELLDDIESIVDCGTRLNIDYYMNEIMEPDQQEELLDYFMETQEDNLEEAIQELGEDFTEDEIRLMRVKFLSEYGN